MSKVFLILAGVVVGILIAPDKGSATRAKISRKLADFTEGMDERMDQVYSGVGDAADNAQDQLFQKADKLQEDIEERL